MVPFDPRSIGLDATLADDFGPFGGVGFLQRAQLSGCAGPREHRRGRPLMFLDESPSALRKKTEAAVLDARLPSTTISALSHQPHTALAGCNTIALR